MAIRRDNQESTQQPYGQQGLTRRGSSAPSVWRDNPSSLMDRFADEMERIFENFGFGQGRLAPFAGRGLLRGLGEGGTQTWSPSIEVFEREGQLFVRAELPGINKDNAKVEVTNEGLVISGERRSEHEEKGQGFYRSERSYGRFYRLVPLPDGVDPEKVKAQFKDGELRVEIPLPETMQRRNREIPIRS